MSCRHSDIRRCSRDIRTLNKMLRILDHGSFGLSDLDYQVERGLSEAKDNTEYGLSPDNLVSLLEQEESFHRTLKQDGSDIVQSCQEELRRLEYELSDLQDEDDQYHEEEDND